MVYKILFAGDLHKKHKDITTIKGYVQCCDAVQESLLNLIKTNNITHFVSLGDWYDRGYVDDISSALADVSVEELFRKELNGNFYGVIGNHVRLKMDSNPELMLIQPHPTIKSRKKVKRDYQVIRTPDSFMVGDVQISLVHHKPQSTSLTDYNIIRKPEAKFHVACLHDPRFVTGYSNTPNSLVAKVLDGVDFAIAGDIHAPLGLMDISQKTKLYVPGSLTNTSVDKRSLHHFVNLPVITVDTDEGTHSVSTVYFDLKTNMVTFVDVKEIAEEKVKTTRGNFREKLYEEAKSSSFGVNLSNMRFGEFLSYQNYTETDKKLVTSIINNPKDVTSLMDLWSKEDIIESI